jgi:hypothetical protein
MLEALLDSDEHTGSRKGLSKDAAEEEQRLIIRRLKSTPSILTRDRKYTTFWMHPSPCQFPHPDD